MGRLDLFLLLFPIQLAGLRYLVVEFLELPFRLVHLLRLGAYQLLSDLYIVGCVGRLDLRCHLFVNGFYVVHTRIVAIVVHLGHRTQDILIVFLFRFCPI